MTDVTYRLIAFGTDIVGNTALTPDLARLVPGGLDNPLIRRDRRLGIERTDWADHSGKLRIVRTVLIDAWSSSLPASGISALIRNTASGFNFFKQKAAAD